MKGDADKLSDYSSLAALWDHHREQHCYLQSLIRKYIHKITCSKKITIPASALYADKVESVI